MSTLDLIKTGQLPSVGNDADEGDKERDEEEEKLRREAIKEAEEKRRVKHKKMEMDQEFLPRRLMSVDTSKINPSLIS